MKLNPEDLDVSSFDTTVESAADTGALPTRTTCSLDPTLCTYCFVCGN